MRIQAASSPVVIGAPRRQGRDVRQREVLVGAERQHLHQDVGDAADLHPQIERLARVLSEIGATSGLLTWTL
jgi:hypothetical protein